MSVMNTGKLQNQANRLHDNATRKAVCVVDKVRYTLEFDGNYNVTDPSGEHVITFNTRKVTQAKAWLREYLA